MKVRTSLIALAMGACTASFSFGQVDANSSNCVITSPGIGQCTETESFAGIPNVNDDFLFDPFDPALGELQSVNVSVSISSSGGALAVDNDSLEGGSGDIEFGLVGGVTSNEVSLFSTLAPPTQFGNQPKHGGNECNNSHRGRRRSA